MSYLWTGRVFNILQADGKFLHWHILSINIFRVRLSFIHDCVDTSELQWASAPSLWSFIIHAASWVFTVWNKPGYSTRLLTSPWVWKNISVTGRKLLSLVIVWVSISFHFTVYKNLFGLIVEEWSFFQMRFQRLGACFHYTVVVFWKECGHSRGTLNN